MKNYLTNDLFNIDTNLDDSTYIYIYIHQK